MQGVEQGFKHRQISGSANRTGIRWEVENHNRDLAFCPFALAQMHQFLHPCSQHLGALSASEHVLGLMRFGEGAQALATGATGALGTGSTAIHHGHGRAIKLGNGDHDGAFHRQQTALGAAPLVQRLKLDGVRCDVGHIELLQSLLGSLGIVVSRSTHQ